MSDIKNLNLGREALGGTVAKVVMMLAGFVGSVIFARVLGPTTYGGVGIILTLVNLSDKPMAGWSIAARKRVSENLDDTAEILGAQIVANIVWLLIAGFGAILLSDWLTDFTRLQHTPLFLFTLLATVGTFSTFQSILKGQGRVSLATWIDTGRSYLTTPAQVGLIVIGWGAAGMVYGLAFASAALIPVTLYFLHTVPRWPSRDQIRSLWSYARYSIPSTAFNLVYNRLDTLILATLLTPTAVGYYDVAWKLTLPVMFLSQSAGSALMSKLSALEAADQADETDLVNTLSFTSVFAIPAFVGAVLLNREIIVTIFGSEYASAWTLLVVLAAYRVVATQSQPMINALNGLDRPDVTMRITGTTIAGNVVLGVGLTLMFGSIGVVIATLLSEIVRYIVAIVMLRREIPEFALVPRAVKEQIIAALIMGGAVWVAQQFVSVVSWIDLGILVGIGIWVYGIVIASISSKLRNTTQIAVDSLVDSIQK